MKLIQSQGKGCICSLQGGPQVHSSVRSVEGRCRGDPVRLVQVLGAVPEACRAGPEGDPLRLVQVPGTVSVVCRTGAEGDPVRLVQVPGPYLYPGRQVQRADLMKLVQVQGKADTCSLQSGPQVHSSVRIVQRRCKGGEVGAGARGQYL